MVCSVAWAMECSQISTICLEDLAIVDWVLPGCRIVLIDFYLGAKGEKVSQAANVVRVPMCDDGVRYRNRFCFENRGEAVRPRWFTFTGVKQETRVAPTHEVGVRSYARSASAKRTPTNT